MKKLILFFLVLNSVVAFQVSAQYDNSTLTGPWFLELPPATPYGDSLMYVVFDGNGNVTAFSGFGCVPIGGTYSVSGSGDFTVNLICGSDNFPGTGQLTSATAGTVDFDETYDLVKVSNPGLLANTWTGTLYTENCGDNNVSITLDNNGIVTSSTGLISPVIGRVYSEGGMFIGHFTTGGTSGWNEFSIFGYYSSNTLTGQIGLDNKGCGNTSVNLNLPTSISEITLNNLAVYPNPATNSITIKTEVLDKEHSTVNIYNTMGSLVKTEVLKQNQQEIDIRDLNDGIYLIAINSKDFTENKKLIIQR